VCECGLINRVLWFKSGKDAKKIIEERRGRFCRIKEASNRSISGICSFHCCMPFTSKHLGTKELHRDEEREKNVGMFVLVIHNCSIKA